MLMLLTADNPNHDEFPAVNYDISPQNRLKEEKQSADVLDLIMRNPTTLKIICNICCQKAIQNVRRHNFLELFGIRGTVGHRWPQR
jgi:hypothetical protein